MWRNSDFKIYFSVLKIYFKAMVPPFMTIYVSAKAATQSFGLFFLRRVLCGALPYRFPNATQSLVTYFLRRVLGDCVSVWFCAATQSFGLFSLRRVLCGALPYRFPNATQSFVTFFLRRVLFNEFLRGERVGQARDEVSDQNLMIRISGATRYGVARMNRSHWARKYGTSTRYWR